MKKRSKTIIAALVLGFSLVAMAEEAVEKKDDGSRPFVPPDFSSLHEKPQGPAVKVEVTCKSREGRVYHQGEPGYELCLSELQRDVGQKNQAPHNPMFGTTPPTGVTQPPGPSMHFNMEFGK